MAATYGALHVITGTARRGAEVFALDLADALTARGRAVRTVALAPDEGSNELRVPVLGSRAIGLESIRALRREAKRARVVVAHGSQAVVVCAIATLGRSIPFVYRNIGDPAFWLDSASKRRRVRWIIRRARVTVALSEEFAALVRELGGSATKTRVIPTGVPADRFPPIDAAARREARARMSLDPGALVAVYVGSLSPEKDVATAIRAVASIPGAMLLAVGEGPDRAALESLAERAAPGRIRFLGALESPREAMAAADVQVLSSKTEGIPGVLIEAAFSELPVVATRVGGIAHVVADGRSGVLFPPGDDRAMAAAIAEAVTDAAAKGRAGRELCIERYEIGVVADAWDALLSELGAWNG